MFRIFYIDHMFIWPIFLNRSSPPLPILLGVSYLQYLIVF